MPPRDIKDSSERERVSVVDITKPIFLSDKADIKDNSNIESRFGENTFWP